MREADISIREALESCINENFNGDLKTEFYAALRKIVADYYADKPNQKKERKRDTRRVGKLIGQLNILKVLYYSP
ncbi:MAG: hypothetical protein LBP55_05365 [Candidatus Adiutrix sp.]|jgi:hypothetical protein|nr:hypothetical protein [Candidatus Adiutrix sp.]